MSDVYNVREATNESVHFWSTNLFQEKLLCTAIENNQRTLNYKFS